MSAFRLSKQPQRTTSPKQFIGVCAVPILLSFVLYYHLQKNQPNRIMQPIGLIVADPEGAAPSLQYPPPKKTTNLGFCMLQKAPFKP